MSCSAFYHLSSVFFYCGFSCYQWGGERLVCSSLCPSCPPFILFYIPSVPVLCPCFPKMWYSESQIRHFEWSHAPRQCMPMMFVSTDIRGFSTCCCMCWVSLCMQCIYVCSMDVLSGGCLFSKATVNVKVHCIWVFQVSFFYIIRAKKLKPVWLSEKLNHKYTLGAFVTYQGM